MNRLFPLIASMWCGYRYNVLAFIVLALMACIDRGHWYAWVEAFMALASLYCAYLNRSVKRPTK